MSAYAIDIENEREKMDAHAHALSSAKITKMLQYQTKALTLKCR